MSDLVVFSMVVFLTSLKMLEMVLFRIDKFEMSVGALLATG